MTRVRLRRVKRGLPAADLPAVTRHGSGLKRVSAAFGAQRSHRVTAQPQEPRCSTSRGPQSRPSPPSRSRPRPRPRRTSTFVSPDAADSLRPDPTPYVIDGRAQPRPPSTPRTNETVVLPTRTNDGRRRPRRRLRLVDAGIGAAGGVAVVVLAGAAVLTRPAPPARSDHGLASTTPIVMTLPVVIEIRDPARTGDRRPVHRRRAAAAAGEPPGDRKRPGGRAPLVASRQGEVQLARTSRGDRRRAQITVGGGKRRALLALLLLHANEVVSGRAADRRAVGRAPASDGGEEPARVRVAAAQGARVGAGPTAACC